MTIPSAKGFAWLRIAFGGVWAIDAWLKWQPTFFSQFTTYLIPMTQNLPLFEAAWLHAWTAILIPHAHTFALIVAIAESLVAISLVLGLMTRSGIIVGTLLSFMIWTIPEAWGGPYTAGATDIGAAIIYIFVFIALWLGKSWSTYSLDAYLAQNPRWKKDITLYLVPERITADLSLAQKDRLLRTLILAVIILGVLVSMQYMPLFMSMTPQATAAPMQPTLMHR